MKHKKILITILVCIITVAAIVAGAAMTWNHWSDYSWVLKANWDFSLPPQAHCQEVYRQNDEPSFHGDGIRYHVFSYRDAKPIEELFSWQSAEKSTIYSDSYSSATEKWLNDIAVPSQERPNYAQCVYWYQRQDDSSEIIVFWDKSSSRIYIAESFL